MFVISTILTFVVRNKMLTGSASTCDFRCTGVVSWRVAWRTTESGSAAHSGGRRVASVCRSAHVQWRPLINLSWSSSAVSLHTTRFPRTTTRDELRPRTSCSIRPLSSVSLNVRRPLRHPHRVPAKSSTR